MLEVTGLTTDADIELLSTDGRHFRNSINLGQVPEQIVLREGDYIPSLGGDWVETIRAVAAAGADVVEVGIPFSDPVMDGPTIQAANELALAAGATPTSILDSLRGADVGVPLAVMTYYNIAYRMGLERFADALVEAGVSGCILPDLPLEEADPWLEVAAAAGVEAIRSSHHISCRYPNP